MPANGYCEVKRHRCDDVAGRKVACGERAAQPRCIHWSHLHKRLPRLHPASGRNCLSGHSSPCRGRVREAVEAHACKGPLPVRRCCGSSRSGRLQALCSCGIVLLRCPIAGRLCTEALAPASATASMLPHIPRCGKRCLADTLARPKAIEQLGSAISYYPMHLHPLHATLLLAFAAFFPLQSLGNFIERWGLIPSIKHAISQMTQAKKITCSIAPWLNDTTCLQCYTEAKVRQPIWTGAPHYIHRAVLFGSVVRSGLESTDFCTLQCLLHTAP